MSGRVTPSSHTDASLLHGPQAKPENGPWVDIKPKKKPRSGKPGPRREPRASHFKASKRNKVKADGRKPGMTINLMVHNAPNRPKKKARNENKRPAETDRASSIDINEATDAWRHLSASHPSYANDVPEPYGPTRPDGDVPSISSSNIKKRSIGSKIFNGMASFSSNFNMQNRNEIVDASRDAKSAYYFGRKALKRGKMRGSMKYRGAATTGFALKLARPIAQIASNMAAVGFMQQEELESNPEFFNTLSARLDANPTYLRLSNTLRVKNEELSRLYKNQSQYSSSRSVGDGGRIEFLEEEIRQIEQEIGAIKQKEAAIAFQTLPDNKSFFNPGRIDKIQKGAAIATTFSILGDIGGEVIEKFVRNKSKENLQSEKINDLLREKQILAAQMSKVAGPDNQDVSDHINEGSAIEEDSAKSDMGDDNTNMVNSSIEEEKSAADILSRSDAEKYGSAEQIPASGQIEQHPASEEKGKAPAASPEQVKQLVADMLKDEQFINRILASKQPRQPERSSAPAINIAPSPPVVKVTAG